MTRWLTFRALLLAPLTLLATAEDDLFFESQVRPVLIKR
jgi:hypothetical protein